MTTISPPHVTAAHRLPQTLLDVDSDFGYRPKDSLVLAIRRRRQRPPATMRVDLPDLAKGSIDDFAHAITGMMARVTAAAGAEVVVYGGDGDDTASMTRFSELVAKVCARLEAAGFEVPRAVLVVGDRWAEASVPALWRALPAIRPPAGSDESGHRSDPHHGPFAPIVPVSERRRSRAMASLALLGRPGRRDPDSDVVEVLLRWNAALAADLPAGPPSDPHTISLAWSLRHKVVRDCVLMMCAWGLDAGIVALHESGSCDTPQRSPRPTGAGDAGDGVFDTFLGIGTRSPAPADLRRAIDLLRHIVSCVPESIAAPPLTMLAWLEWARGRGSIAGQYLDVCLRIDPGYELARLFGQVIDRAFLPEWLGDDPGSSVRAAR